MKICSMRRKLAILLCLATLVSMSAPASAAFLPSEIAKETITESTDDSDWYMAGANPQRTSWVSEEVRGKLYVTVTVVEGTKPIGHLIKDLVVSSGKSYQIDILGVGKHPYIDRDFLFTEVPASLHNYFYIRTANDDRDYTDKDHLRFTLMQSTKVYIAFDQRAGHLPDWLTGWTLESELLAIGDEEFQLYTRHFPAGEVSLGGNAMPPMAGAQINYLVLIAPVGESMLHSLYLPVITR